MKRGFMNKLFLVFTFIFTMNLSANSVTMNAKVTASKKCSKETEMVAFVHYADKPNEYLYQVEVPVNGNVEFAVLPGLYELEAVNKIGCFGKLSIDAREPASAKKELNLEIKE